jgi:hypothetical protein
MNRQAVTRAIPLPLATALLNDRGIPTATRPAPRFAVGTLPDRYPVTLVPTGPVAIVGGMTTGDEVVAVFADSTRRLSAVFEELFTRDGFNRPPSSPGAGFSPRSGPYSYFCRDSETVSAQPLTGANRNLVRVDYRVIRAQRACATADAFATHGLLHLPELTPPPGARVSGSHGASGGDGGPSSTISSSADLTGAALVPSAILAHYAAQLSAAGWTGAPPAISEKIAAEFFEAKDAAGATWEGALTIVANSTVTTASLAMHVRAKP